MKKFLAMLLLAAPLAAQPTPISNGDCTALDEPYPCCSGAGTGTCNGKAAWVIVAASHAFTEVCATFWFSENCGSLRDVNVDGTRTQWLVSTGVCTQEEADNQVPLRTRAADCIDVDLATIDGEEIAVPWCTGAGTSDGSEHVVTCTGSQITNNRCQSSGTWDFTDSDFMPSPVDCVAAFHAWFKGMLIRERNQGRLDWENEVRGQFPQSTDPLE